MEKTDRIHHYLYKWLLVITMLITIGIIAIYSASSVYALEKLNNHLFFLHKQCSGILIGIFLAGIIAIMPTKLISSSIYGLYCLGVAITSLTLFSSYKQTIHGSSRWINYGTYTFQPTEFLKYIVILTAAYFLSSQTSSKNISHKDMLLYIVLVGLPCTIILLQPDFGMSFVIMLTCTILFFTKHFRIKYALAIIIAFSTLCTSLVILSPYRLRRILIFLNPWNDPQGSGFQIIQSLIAIGNGGIHGVGIGCSKQKLFYLPMQHTDFIFSIIAEEIGFIGTICIIILYMFYTYYGMKIAVFLKDEFSKYASFGIIIITTIQAMINMSVSLGMLPTKGVGLPFMSYGKSALISGLCATGFIINVLLQQKKIAHQTTPIDLKKQKYSL